MLDRIIAIDIGSKDIMAIVASLDKKRKIHIHKVEQMEVSGIANGEIKDKKEVNLALQSLLKKLHENQFERISNIFVANNNRFLQQIKRDVALPINNEKITAKHIKQINEKAKAEKLAKDTQIVDVMADNFFVDNQKKIDLPFGLNGEMIKAPFSLITAKKSSVNTIKKGVELKGFKLQKFFVSSLVAADVLLSNQDKAKGMGLFNFEDETSSFLIYFEGVLQHFITLPFGWSHIISDILTACKISRKDAVNLFNAISKKPNDKIFYLPREKGKVARKIDDKTLKYIIYARLFEIMEGIHFHLKFNKIVYKIKGGIILTGRYGESIFLENLLKRITKVEVSCKSAKYNYINKTRINLKTPKYNVLLGIVKDVLTSSENAELNHTLSPE